CWPKRPWIIKPGLITVSVGDPIPSQGQTPESLTEAVRLWIEEEMLVISPHRYKASIKQITESGAELL
ncbi:MAG: 1-acyl-sn-glycerol-3-phosphate acyltransferase, partial [Betaproteobacteria bacterium]|nr:1-acyl-sn-glycerol-3-phosphate acyltransferase [Betaproteobacteria bacterium]